MANEVKRKKVLVIQLCPTLCNPMDCSLPGYSVHGIFQARILEWVAIPFSRESSKPRDQTQVSCMAGRFFTIWVTRETLAGEERLMIELLAQRLNPAHERLSAEY